AALKRICFKVTVTREPGGTKISDQIRQILLSQKNRRMVPLCELFLYEASRAQHVQEVIKPALKRGQIVISDRFYDASWVYQGYVRGISRKWVEKLNLFATGGLEPDLTLILDCPVEKGLSRLQSRKKNLDRLEKEKRSFHERVRRGYLLLASINPRRVRVIDGNREPKEVHQDILKQVLKKI
ncbi:MAG: dTMP kinase, partial [Deltaproteobacteria bacterium]